jgi:GWxTD domain-containing protein
VVYIITDEERKAFLPDHRRRARQVHGRVSGPFATRCAAQTRNPYKEEHYARIEYANSHFGRESTTPGWMTDMGRAYILFGAPTSRHPFVGYSQIYPMELWFYDNKTNSPALPSFFYLLFYIDGDIGDYKFYRPFLDGPMKLVRGSQFNSNRDVYKFLQPMGGDVAHAVHVAGAERARRYGELSAGHVQRHAARQNRELRERSVQRQQAPRDALAARQGQIPISW